MHELEKLAAQHCAIILRLFSAQIEARIFLLQLRTKRKDKYRIIEQGMMNVELESAFIIRNSLFDIRNLLVFDSFNSIVHRASEGGPVRPHAAHPLPVTNGLKISSSRVEEETAMRTRWIPAC